MAAVTSTLSLTSTDLTTDSLSVSVTNNLSGINTGGMTRINVAAENIGASETLAAHGSYAATTYVYVKNCDTGADNIYLVLAGADNMVIAPGEWVWFPWATVADIKIWATTAGTVAEYGIFGA
mgnify:CR=1 FL=1|tara:strand:+ start:320 stop:688 length:369 start_codon:yes stop_codon:yes gene_type:complete